MRTTKGQLNIVNTFFIIVVIAMAFIMLQVLIPQADTAIAGIAGFNTASQTTKSITVYSIELFIICIVIGIILTIVQYTAPKRQ